MVASFRQSRKCIHNFYFTMFPRVVSTIQSKQKAKKHYQLALFFLHWSMVAFSTSIFYGNDFLGFIESDNFSEEENWYVPTSNEETSLDECTDDSDQEDDMGIVDRADHYCASYVFS